jgi:hypothetical protein
LRAVRSTIYLTALVANALLLSACFFGGPPKCETEGRYQLSQEGQRIQAPEDLDDLASYKEETIPRASPRAPREDTGRCLEAPPRVSSGSSN